MENITGASPGPGSREPDPTVPALTGFDPSRSLDSEGRCCGRKPLEYKRPPRLFCCRCDRQFDPETKQQQENWAWKATEGGFVAVCPKPVATPS